MEAMPGDAKAAGALSAETAGTVSGAAMSAETMPAVRAPAHAVPAARTPAEPVPDRELAPVGEPTPAAVPSDHRVREPSGRFRRTWAWGADYRLFAMNVGGQPRHVIEGDG